MLDLRKQNTITLKITHLPRVILIGGVALEDFGLLTLFSFFFFYLAMVAVVGADLRVERFEIILIVANWKVYYSRAVT